MLEHIAKAANQAFDEATEIVGFVTHVLLHAIGKSGYALTLQLAYLAAFLVGVVVGVFL